LKVIPLSVNRQYAKCGKFKEIEMQNKNAGMVLAIIVVVVLVVLLIGGAGMMGFGGFGWGSGMMGGNGY
jgi:hypothetical protein